MKELSPKQIAAWHRTEAQKYYDLYVIHKDMADRMTPSTTRFSEMVTTALIEQGDDGTGAMSHKPMFGEITVEQLNAALRNKQGRVAHVAERLKTLPSVVELALKDPKSEYAVGPRGFIYPKNSMPKNNMKT